MTVLEKIKRCVSLVWDFQEFYGDEDIEDFCSNELDTYSQYNEILDYFKRITELEQENKVLAQNLEDTEIVNKSLEKENAEAKGIIREYYNLKNFPCASGNSINMLMYENINHKAEAFLKE